MCDNKYMPFIREDGRIAVQKWNEYYYRQTLELEPRLYERVLFRECVITKCKGARLINCVLAESKFAINRIEDMQGCSLTLDCGTFSNVELSEAAFDYITLLLVRGKGNTEKRLKLIEALGGKQEVQRLLRAADCLG